MEGFISGFVGTIITHPLELLKIKKQIGNGNGIDTGTSIGTGVGNGIGKINLTNGIFLNATVYGLHYLIYFELYSKLKSEYQLNPFYAGFLAQGTSSLLLNPLWIIRTKKLGLNQSYSTILKDFNKNYFTRGILSSNLICLQTATSFGILEYLNGINCNGNRNGNQNSIILINGLLARTISGIIFYPFDTFRNIIRAQTNDSFINLTNSLIKQGPFRFYNGLSIYLIKSVPNFVIVNFIYSKLIKIN